MRVIIAGWRHAHPSAQDIHQALADAGGWRPSRILCGGAPGADQAGLKYALAMGIPVGFYPADWVKYGRAAGPIRNQKMAQNADALLLFWNRRSKGSESMLRMARARNLKIHEIVVKEGR